MEKDRIDLLIEKKTMYKKLHERIGVASYIKWKNVLGADNIVRKVETNRVELNIEDGRIGSISAYKAETMCPYGGSKCAVSLYSDETKLFMKKLRVMKFLWRLDKYRSCFLRIFKRFGRA